MKSPDQGAIASMADLRAEMQRVKERVIDHEQQLGKRWKQVPMETIKVVLGGIIPLFIGGELGAGAFKLVKGLFELIKNKKEGDGSESKWKEDLTGGATKLGIFTGLKLLLNLWKGK